MVVAVFDNGNYVDTAGSASSESDTIQATLTNLGHTVQTFTDDTGVGFTTALAGVNVLVMPENERSTAYTNLSTDAKNAIRDFVNNGGKLIINGDWDGVGTVDFMNELFGWSLQQGQNFWSNGGHTFTKTAATAGTAYDAAPATVDDTNGTYTIKSTSLPSSAMDIYDDGTNSAAFTANVGAGEVTFLAYDWFNSEPLGSFHTTWPDVLNIVVNSTSTQNVVMDDYRNILENGDPITGNVFTNNALPEDEMTVKPGSLTSANGNVADANGVIQGKYGQLTLNSDGTYTYTLNQDMDHLGAGVDLHDEVFTFTTEYHKPDGSDASKEEHLKIDIHGTNDASVVADVNVRTFEGGDHAGGTIFYNGQFTLEDVNPNVDGVQTDLDDNDTHTFAIDNGTVTITSTDLTAEQIAAIKSTLSIHLNPTNGKYKVKGNFDALSVGDEATISFEYWSVDHSEVGSATETAHKTANITVVGENDTVSIVDDTIVTYDQLIDGDIYKSILANDGHYDPLADLNDPSNVNGATMVDNMDVHDTLEIASTGFHDLQFYNEGGQISVDNAARMLQYTPGTGGAIAKDHFSFYYQATDRHTDPIVSAVAEFKMVNGNIGAGAVPLYGTNNPIVQVDFYQFGDNSDNTINGIKGKSNVLSGMGGDDYIEGKKKADILYGGDGDDDLHGGWGNDIYKGGKGTDGIVDTRGNDLYVFSKGDGRDTIDDTSLEIYTDDMGHKTINENYLHQLTEDYYYNFYDSAGDVVRFDKSVDISKIAIFQEDGQYGSLLIKYSENADDKVSVGWQQEDHYGIERIQAYDANGQLLMIDTRSDENGTYGQMHRPKQFDTDLDGINDLTYDELIAYIASYDLDGDITNGVQAAENVQDVQNNEHLMAVIATGWHYKPF